MNMTSEELAWSKVLQDEQQQRDGNAPDFSKMWAAAAAEARPQRKLAIPVAVASAAIVAAITIGLLLANQQSYVDMDALMSSTSWSAPSDSLLPTHQIDIYREVPRLIESTEPLEGALL